MKSFHFVRMAQSLKFGFFALVLAVVGFGLTSQAHAEMQVTMDCKVGVKAYFYNNNPLLLVVLEGDKYIKIDAGLFAAGNGKILTVANKVDHIEIRKYVSAESFNRKRAATILECK